MNEDNMSEVLPIAPMTGESVTVDQVDAEAFELKPTKKYLIVLYGYITAEEAKQVQSVLESRGINASILTVGDVKAIYELE